MIVIPSTLLHGGGCSAIHFTSRGVSDLMSTTLYEVEELVL